MFVLEQDPVERKRAYMREWYQRNKLHHSVNRHHKVSGKWYNARLTLQQGVCAICKRAPGKKRLEVDHDHKLPQPQGCRGLLCGPCNLALAAVENEGVQPTPEQWAYLLFWYTALEYL